MFSDKMITRMSKSSQVAVLTGAGISAESGVSTFRGREGVWNKFDPQKLASPQALENQPEEFWEFYNWRRKALIDAKPNLGHYALVDMENFFSEFTLITQNVDNLHRMAGSRNLYELHGNITRTRCQQCGKYTNEPMDATIGKIKPQCPGCSGLLRPDVVLFGEPLPMQALQSAQEAAATCDIFFSIGTSALVEPAASLPYIAKANGAYVVEINPEKTALSMAANEVIQGKSGSILPQLVMVLEKYK